MILKLIFTLTLSNQLMAAETFCPHAVSLMNKDLATLTGMSENDDPFPNEFQSIVVSSSPTTSPRCKIYAPTDTSAINETIGISTGNHFEGVSTEDLSRLTESTSAYVSFYYQDIILKFPFLQKPQLIMLEDFKAQGSVGTGICEYHKNMIRLVTTEYKFLYLRLGSDQINSADIFNFCQNMQTDVCQVSLPHFMIHTALDFQLPSKECLATNTPFSLVRQKYAIECNPCLQAVLTQESILEPAADFNFNAPFVFCLTDITHTTTYTQGYISNTDQLVPFTRSRFNYGCNPSTDRI